jgi:F0F1-type ATP synthase epsilon subunit
MVASSSTLLNETLQEPLYDETLCAQLEADNTIRMDWESSPREISLFVQENLDGVSMAVYRPLGYDYKKLPASSKNLVLRLYTLASGWALGEIDSLVVPGANGEFCILKDHVNFLCRTDPGIIKISWSQTRRGRGDFIYVLASSGMFYLKDNIITIVCLGVEDPYSYELEDTRVALEVSQNWVDETRRICEGSGSAGKTSSADSDLQYSAANQAMADKRLWAPTDPFNRYPYFVADSFERYLQAQKRLRLAKVRKKAASLVASRI